MPYLGVACPHKKILMRFRDLSVFVARHPSRGPFKGGSKLECECN